MHRIFLKFIACFMTINPEYNKHLTQFSDPSSCAQSFEVGSVEKIFTKHLERPNMERTILRNFEILNI